MDFPSLQQVNSELERRVGERTAALASMNAALQAEIAERERAEEALHQLNSELAGAQRRTALILHALEAAAGSLDLDQVLERIAQTLAASVGASHCVIYLHDPESSALLPAATTGSLDEAQQEVLHRLLPDPGRSSLVREALDARRALATLDARTHPQANQELARCLDLRSALAVPLQRAGRVLGIVLAFTLGVTHAFTPADAELAEGVAQAVALAIDNARLHAETQRRLEESQRLGQAMAHQAAQLAVLEERGRLARELHDSVTQSLYSSAHYVHAATRALEAGREEAAAGYLCELRDTTQEAMRDMRLLIFELHPPVIEKEGLVAALQGRLAAVENRAGLQAELRVEGERPLPIGLAEELYRAAHEALNNVLKHAHALHVSVNLRFANGAVVLEIADDGAGFDPGAVQGAGGLGLQGIRERAARLGAELAISSAPGCGARLTLVAPIPCD